MSNSHLPNIPTLQNAVIVQTAFANFTSTDTDTTGFNTTWYSTPITVSITPTKATNRMLIIVHLCAGTTRYLAMRIDRSGTPLETNNSGASFPAAAAMRNSSASAYQHFTSVFHQIDSTYNTTSSITYTLQTSLRHATSGTININSTATDTDSSAFLRGASGITVFEIEG